MKLDVPILSIDYSLAPEAPFPRAFEDIFYTYCWILKNVELVGSTGENIVFAGDSAGGNLNTACVVKAIEMGIPIPRGLFNAYTPFLVNFASSPARFLSLVDPLLPYGFIMRVFKSYGAVDCESTLSTQNNHVESSNSDKKEIIREVFDDNRDDSEALSPDFNKSLETMWHKIKDNTEGPDWHTNLGAIRETPSEEPSSPFDYSKNLSREVSTNPELGTRTLSEENIVLDVGKDALSVQNFSESIQKATTSIVNAVTVPFRPASSETPNKLHLKIEERNEIPTAPDDTFVFSVPLNHYLSPYWASDEVLREFPPTNILSTIVDPCLDDCVEFSKKLKKLDVDIKVDILEGLNHGFLNFAQVTLDKLNQKTNLKFLFSCQQVSKECHEGSMLCMRRIAELLDLDL